MIAVDTSVWSLLLRRKRPDDASPWVRTLRRCVEDGCELVLIGPVLQELLNGCRSPSAERKVLEALKDIPLAPARRETFIFAAQIQNTCRRHGVQAGSVDAFLAAVCIENELHLLTADSDFDPIARWCGLSLVSPEA